MEDQIISFETAKLAKEKGFNVPVRSMYLDSELFLDKNTKGNYNDPNWVSSWRTSPTHDTLSAPTQSLLQKWLREVHRIDIYCYPNYDKKGVTFQVNLYTDPYVKFKDTNHFYKGGYKTYEEALEEGLYEALKLI